MMQHRLSLIGAITLCVIIIRVSCCTFVTWIPRIQLCGMTIFLRMSVVWHWSFTAPYVRDSIYRVSFTDLLSRSTTALSKIIILNRPACGELDLRIGDTVMLRLLCYRRIRAFIQTSVSSRLPNCSAKNWISFISLKLDVDLWMSIWSKVIAWSPNSMVMFVLEWS